MPAAARSATNKTRRLNLKSGAGAEPSGRDRAVGEAREEMGGLENRETREKFEQSFNRLLFNRQERLTSDFFKQGIEELREKNEALLADMCDRDAKSGLARMDKHLEERKNSAPAHETAPNDAENQYWNWAMCPWEDLATLGLMPENLREGWLAAASACGAKMPQLTALVEAATLNGIVSAASQQDDASGASSASSASRGRPRL